MDNVTKAIVVCVLPMLRVDVYESILMRYSEFLEDGTHCPMTC